MEKKKRYKYRGNKHSNWVTMLLTEERVKDMKIQGYEFWVGSQTNLFNAYGRNKKEKI